MNIKEFLGIDKLAELNAQRMPEYWPMKDGPVWYDNLVVDNMIELGFTTEEAVDGLTKRYEEDWNNE